MADLEDVVRAEDARRRFGRRYHDAARNIGFTALGGSNFKEIIMAAQKIPPGYRAKLVTRVEVAEGTMASSISRNRPRI